LRANKDAPVKVFIKDFDKNGSVEKIFSHTLNGKDMPVFLKKDITEQLPALKKENLKHQDFAPKTIQELFPNTLSDARVLSVNTGASIIALNNSNKGFSVQALPYQLQLSSVQSLVVEDMNGDGHVDLLAAGNFFDLLPQFCSIDASYGNLLLGNGKAGFSVASPQQSGVSINGQIKQILPLRLNNQLGYLFLQNNDYPVYFRKTSAVKK
jgi:hypothetical protein